MEKLIVKLYTAFSKYDAETMASCYHEEVIFEDPAFGVLHGERVMNMWRMLIDSQKGKDFKVSFSDVKADEKFGSALWEAEYIFSKSGKDVHNKIFANFEFKDGLIIKHTDTFNLQKWASQALGFKGWLLGRTSFFKKKLQAQTNTLLDKFENS